MHPNVHSSSIYNSQVLEATYQCPSENEWIKKLWYIYTMEFYAAERKKKLLPFATAWMELESIMLSEVPYDLTYKWNLINKTNKQAKCNQRHWNKEQTDSNQRGGGREIKGERRGRIIKERL